MADRIPRRQPSTSSSRRTSTGPFSNRPSSVIANPDIFSDDFALEPLSVTDGFRPSPSAHDAIPRTPSPTTPPFNRRTSTSHQLRQDDTKKRPRRTGSSHMHSRVNSFTLRHDGPTSRNIRRAPSTVSDTSDAAVHGQRPLSVISNITVSRPQSLYQGTTGPSHPYGMYPQGIALARSASTASTSTLRPRERSYPGANRSTHPYGTYPQNTTLDGEVSPIETTDSHIPVGFPGLSQQYIRRLGPDGEDADDIIGPDGHTEALPPYTRYPDHIPHKEPTPGSGATFENEVSPGLLHPADRDLSRIDSVPSNESTQQINVIPPDPGAQADESGNNKEKWTAVRKRRCSCLTLPKWAMALIIFLSVSLAAILGGVIGHGISHRNSKDAARPAPAQESAAVAVSSAVPTIIVATVTTTLVDATPLSSIPTDLPSLPTGSFIVPIGTPSASSGSCLTDPNQQSAWGCAMRAYLSLQVTPTDYSPTQVSLSSNYSLSSSIRYGPQPPSLDNPSVITLMIDKEDVNRGPAYFFQQAYDKVIVLQTSQLQAPSKRELGSISDLALGGRGVGRGFRGQVAQPGEQPWFCYWNNTIVEGFIYVTENTMLASGNTTDPSWPSTTTSATGAYNSPFSPSSTLVNNYYGQPPSRNPPYSKVIKIKERRLTQNSVKPYCVQMQVLNDGTVNSVPDPSGDPIIVELGEIEPPIEQSVHLWGKKREAWSNDETGTAEDGLRERQSNSACFCEWLST